MREPSYDDFPYECFAVKQTHPYHLYTVAKLYGFTAVPVERANVLELGCASGENIIPMAFHLPNARFCGIDLSKQQIENGMQQVQALQLKNISLIHQSILDFKIVEKFDYIICHGLYSWVDEKVREKVLEICKNALTLNGIAYISYNTFPGWKVGGIVRDMMLLYTAHEKTLLEKAKKARTLLADFATQLKNENTAFSVLVNQELDILLQHSDTQLIHEHLGATNHPFYFDEFMNKANHHHLHFLADAFFTNMRTELPPTLAFDVENEPDRILMGQYMDFLKNRRFRATLLCHQIGTVQSSQMQAAISQCYLKLAAFPDKDFSEKDIDTPTEISFSNSTVRFSVKEPLFKLTMWILQETQDRPIHYRELGEKVAQKNPLWHQNQAILPSFLIEALLGGIIDVSLNAPDYTLEITLKPLACPFARYQVYQQSIVTNRRHENIQLTPLAQAMLPYLDGTHDLETLISIVNDFIAQGALSFDGEDNKREPIATLCSKTLTLLAKQALLIG